jgi:hypothetical protein
MLAPGFTIAFPGGGGASASGSAARFCSVVTPVFALLVLAALAEDFTFLLVVTAAYPENRA